MAKGNTAGLVAKRFGDDGTFPNSRLPLLLYREALRAGRGRPGSDGGAVRGEWLAAALAGERLHLSPLSLDGARGARHRERRGDADAGRAERREFDVAAGDVIVIPAGVVHRRLSSSADFLVVGGYPPGQDWDLLRGEPDDRPKADHNIANVPMPKSDPVGGSDGPLLTEWRK